MKHQWWALTALLCACGGNGNVPDPGRLYELDEVYPTVPEPGRPYEMGEVYPETPPEAAAELVDAIAWHDERIEFWNTSPGQAEPQILTTLLGTEGNGEILTRLQQQSPYLVTPAELWRAVTDREDVPEVLARAHEITAAFTGRPLEYSDFDLGLEDKLRFSFTAMFPTTPTADTCWNAGLLKQLVGPDRGISTSTVCSDFGPSNPLPARTTPVALESTCGRRFATKLQVRAGVFVGSATGSQVARVCYDSGSLRGWQCLNSVAILEGQYYAQEYAPSSFDHRFGIGVDSPTLNTTLVYGSAVARAGLPAFQTTSCVALPAP